MWTEIIGGSAINNAETSYKSYVISTSVTLEWPLEAAGTDVVADIINVSSAAAASVIMPSALKGTSGSAVLFYNSGAYTITIKNAIGGTIASIATGKAHFVALTANATEAGTWLAFEFGAGTSIAQAAALASGSVAAQGTSLVQAIPVFAVNSTYTIGSAERGNLVNWTGGVGTLTLTNASILGAAWFCHVRNSGSGALTVDPTGAELIDTASSIILNPGESTTVVCDGTSFYTVSKIANAISNFSYLAINVAGTGDYTLSAVEQGYAAYRLTGALTGARNIIVPTTLGEYIFTNSTSGAFVLTVKTAAGTGVVLNTGESKLLYCDGANVMDAATAGISVPVAVSQGGTGGTTASSARTNLGATSVGNAVFVATTDAAARTAIGVTAVGDAIVIAATKAAARTAIDLGNVNNTSDADKPISTAVQVALDNYSDHGGCELVVESTTVLRLKPLNGSRLIINGVSQEIPAAGVALANTALTLTTVQYIYAYMSAGVMTLEASATAYARGSDGTVIKGGPDATRTLVGCAYRFADGFLYDDITRRACLSWFNRRNKEIAFVASGASAGALGVAIGTIGYFLLWNGEGAFFQLGGWVNNNTVDYAYGSIFLNGARGHISGGYVSVAGVQVATGSNNSMTGGAEALNSVQGGVGVNAAGTATLSGHLRGIIRG